MAPSGDNTEVDDRVLDAGPFSGWWEEARDAIRGAAPSVVPCDGCTACCTASQFVHIGPDESDTLAHIPRRLLFPAPLRPPGHLLLGYDEHGRCPMLRDGKCSIYPHRPQACRTYDCRVFAATGVGLPEHPHIDRQARRWAFRTPTEQDRTRARAARAAAAFLEAHPEVLPTGAPPLDATRHAVLALEISDLFAGDDAPADEQVRARVAAARGGGAP
ncbi:MAG TPA: YkgJ family cysteine cluster protein [Acidimicrobiales bacterium]|nr:YkgJ family cysteine cluster protein [Acidimicrobiales bacterium]